MGNIALKNDQRFGQGKVLIDRDLSSLRKRMRAARRGLMTVYEPVPKEVMRHKARRAEAERAKKRENAKAEDRALNVERMAKRYQQEASK